MCVCDPQQIIFSELWGRLLFAAFNAAWLYIDYLRDVDLTKQPEYMHYDITCKEIIGEGGRGGLWVLLLLFYLLLLYWLRITTVA